MIRRESNGLFLVVVLVGVVGCGSGGGSDATADAGTDDCPLATPGAAAWTPVAVPAKHGSILGAAGDTVIVQGGGVFTSTDRGVSWQAATFFGQPIEAVDDFAADPRTPGRIWLEFAGAAMVADDGVNFVDSYIAWPLAPDYVNGGELFATCNNLPSCRLLRSTDQTVPVLDGVRITALATFALEPQRIVILDATAGQGARILRLSVDGGANWTDAFTAGDVDTLRRGAGAREVWATTAADVLHSTDGGTTWSAFAHPLTRMLPSTTTAGRAYAVGYARDLQVTEDGGESWTSVDAPYGVDSATDFANAEMVVATVGGVFRGDGDAWTALDAPLVPMWVTEVVQAGATRLIAVNDGNGPLPAWRSADGTSWEALAELRGFENVPGTPDVIYASDGGSIVRSSDRGATWDVRTGAASGVAPSADPEVVYGAEYIADDDVSIPYLARSLDGGNSFERLDVVLEGYPWVRTDRIDAARLYVHGSVADGTVETLSSADQGVSWSSAGAAWWTLRPDATVAGRVWRSGNAVVLQRSDDAGATWMDVPGSPPDVVGQASLDDGSLLAFTAAGLIWELSATGTWEMLGPAPGEVARVTSWGAECPDAITLLTSDGVLFESASRGRVP